MSTHYITVVTSSDLSVVERYLYDHTRVVEAGTADGRNWLVLETTADTESLAEYLAQYQADRLSSGNHAAAAASSREAAEAILRERFAITVTNNVTNLSTTDVAADILNVIDGHIVKDYFSDGSSVSYDATTGGRTDQIEVIAEDSAGNKRTFIVSVREARS